MLSPPPYILPPFARQDRKKSSSIHTICPLSSPSHFLSLFPRLSDFPGQLCV
jgi:hypothetical protein